jgi:UDP-galactopyranose mutase
MSADQAASLPTIADHDGFVEALYHLLWAKTFNGEPCQVLVPDTIIYKYRIPAYWYFTGADGRLRRKNKASIINQKIFKDYTYKQWAKYPAELDASVLARIPVRTTHDPYYFSDEFQALPKDGYTAFIANMIRDPRITVQLNTEYTHPMRADYDYVFFSGPIDQFYAAAGYPRLEYRSIRFEIEHLDTDQFQPNSVVNYPSATEPFTRIVEYKHFLNEVVPGNTTIVREYTTADGDPYYPVPTAANQETFALYRNLAAAEKKIFFVGRLANYKYYNMDAAILAALEMADSFQG